MFTLKKEAAIDFLIQIEDYFHVHLLSYFVLCV